MEITIEKASLNTVSVELKIIQVNKKQMTLAVFRQLPEGHEEFDSSLWGLVRYNVKGGLTGTWLVFSKDGILYRRNVHLVREPIKNYSKVNSLQESLRTAERNLKYDQQHNSSSVGYYEKEIKRIKFELVKARQAIESNYDLDSIRYNHYNKVIQLPQLFIAV